MRRAVQHACVLHRRRAPFWTCSVGVAFDSACSCSAAFSVTRAAKVMRKTICFTLPSSGTYQSGSSSSTKGTGSAWSPTPAFLISALAFSSEAEEDEDDEDEEELEELFLDMAPMRQGSNARREQREARTCNGPAKLHACYSGLLGWPAPPDCAAGPGPGPG